MPKVIKSKAVKVEAVTETPAIVVPENEASVSTVELTVETPSVKKERKANKYLVFFKQFTAEWKAAHPEAKFKEIGAEAGKKWRSMSKEEKAVL